VGQSINPIDATNIKTLVDDLVLKPKVGQMDNPPGDYMEVEFDWKKELDDGDCCGLVSQGSRKFDWPLTNFPGNPGYCFSCALGDLRTSRLRGQSLSARIFLGI
jgi:hypothetical protein